MTALTVGSHPPISASIITLGFQAAEEIQCNLQILQLLSCQIPSELFTVSSYPGGFLCYALRGQWIGLTKGPHKDTHYSMCINRLIVFFLASSIDLKNQRDC